MIQDGNTFICTESQIFGDRWLELVDWLYDRDAKHHINRKNNMIELTFLDRKHAMEFKLKFFQ